MAQPRPLPPALSDRAAYEAIQPDAQTWLPAMGVICQRQGVPAGALARLSEGNNVVFAAGTQHIIKLYSPHWRRLCAVERLVAEHLHAKLSVTTTEIVAANELEGWPYLVMQRLAGRYLAEVWDHLSLANLLQLVTALGALISSISSPAASVGLLIWSRGARHLGWARYRCACDPARDARRYSDRISDTSGCVA